MGAAMIEPKFLPEEVHSGLRTRFCALDDGRLFFNNAAGALRLRSVMELQSEMGRIPDYPSRGSREAAFLDESMKLGKESLRLLLGAPDQGEVVQDMTASRLLFSLINAAARQAPKGRLIVTSLDHPSAIDGAKRSAEYYGRELCMLPLNRATHNVDADVVCKEIERGASILVMTCTSNTTGAVLPYAEIVRRARRINPELYLILDGVQRVPHGSINLAGYDVDAVVIAPYKVFSARGSGLGWVSERMNRIGRECLIGQASSTWSLGSVDPVSFGLMKPVADYFEALGAQFSSGSDRQANIRLGQERVEAHERALLELMLEGRGDTPGLRRMPRIVVHFDREDILHRDLIVSVSAANGDNFGLYERLLERRVITSFRSGESIFCGDILRQYGLDSVIRISPMHYHSPEEILEFLRILAEVA